MGKIAISPEHEGLLRNVIQQGVTVKTQIAALNEGLKDAVKNIADETGWKPADINKAISVRYKDNLDDEQEKFDAVSQLLEIAG